MLKFKTLPHCLIPSNARYLHYAIGIKILTECRYDMPFGYVDAIFNNFG
jgi:hypothetical protein